MLYAGWQSGRLAKLEAELKVGSELQNPVCRPFAAGRLGTRMQLLGAPFPHALSGPHEGSTGGVHRLGLDPPPVYKVNPSPLAADSGCYVAALTLTGWEGHQLEREQSRSDQLRCWDICTDKLCYRRTCCQAENLIRGPRLARAILPTQEEQ